MQSKNYLLALTSTIIAATIFFTKPSVANTSSSTAPNVEDHNNVEDQNEHQNIDPEDQAILDHFLETIYARDAISEDKASDIKLWIEHIYRELPTLGPDLLTVYPLDAKIFCPNYKNLTESRRNQFWAFFILAIARFESNLDPNTTYKENFTDSSGKRVISRGLLQISFESSKGYQCGFSTAKEIHNPTRNLSCGIRILNKWMKTDSRIASKVGSQWKGGARYWSVLRAGRNSSYKYIVKATNALPFCKL